MAEETQANQPEAAATEVSNETPAEPANEADKPAKAIADWSHIEPGMVVRVHQRIKEMTPKGEERERIQVFEGTVIAKKGKDKMSSTVTVRKVSGGIGVERIFPLKLPTIAKIEEVKRLRTRRSKLYFIRKTGGRKLKEKKAGKR